MQRVAQGPRGDDGQVAVMSASSLLAKWGASAPYLLSALRIVAAFMFFRPAP